MGVRYPRPLICHVNSEEKKRRSLRISRSDIVRVAVVSRHHAGHPNPALTARATEIHASTSIANYVRSP
jgi:hypothetical protein